MTTSDNEGGSRGRPESAHGDGGAVRAPEASPPSVAKTLVAALVVAAAAGVLGWILGDKFRVAEIVDLDEFYGGAELSVALATRNVAVNYAIVGALLSLGLGVSAGWFVGPRSIARGGLAGLAGAVLGACGGAASSYLLSPRYFGHMETADLTLTLLIHLGIWTAVGGASGVAFGIGLGSRHLFVLSLIGGIIGGALGTLLFDLSGVFLPVAHTERPLAEASGVRLAGDMLLSLCVAVGIVVVVYQKPRVAAKATRHGTRRERAATDG
jgi:hypothetical protein